MGEEKEGACGAGLELKHTHTLLALLKEQSSNDISVELSIPNAQIFPRGEYSNLLQYFFLIYLFFN